MEHPNFEQKIYLSDFWMHSYDNSYFPCFFKKILSYSFASENVEVWYTITFGVHARQD